MSPVEDLRDFISQRLTAAAVEIFSQFEQTIVRYEEEIDRQRALLQVRWNPGIKSSAAEIPSPCVPEEHHIWNLERNPDPDQEEPEPEPEPPQIKEEHDDGEDPDFKFIDLSHDDPETEEETEAPQIPVGLELCGLQDPKFSRKCHQQSFSDEQGENPLCSSSSALPTRDQQKRKPPNNDAPEKPVELREENSHSPENPPENDSDGKCLKCGLCGKEFKFFSQLKQHHRRHTGEKPFSCQTCGKNFGMKHHLKTHMIIHTGEKPCFCENCGKSFRDNSSLSAHMRTHTGEKPYSCEICGKSFSQQRSLFLHVKTHSGEKPYLWEAFQSSHSSVGPQEDSLG